jgi:glycogen operon protein
MSRPAEGTVLAPSGQGGETRYWFKEHELAVTRGFPLPLGASLSPGGVNFVLLSRHATAVTLVLAEPCNSEVRTEIALDPHRNRTGEHWHIRVSGLPEQFCYGYRVDGPRGPQHRYNPSRILLDPAARFLSCGRPWGMTGRLPRLSLVNRYIRSEDVTGENPSIPPEDSILYELHVRGYTVHPNSGVRAAGTYAGLVEKLPYLKELGVTSIELLPIDEFDENDCPFENPFTGERLRNFWGYNTIAFAAPKAAYARNPEGTAPWEEFRWMVERFHEAGMEVILDVVFNHSAEGNDEGPTYNFRGIDNALYYMMDEHGKYMNFSGCGNTFNSNHPVVRYMLLSCVRNWVAEADIDGFRFDLASVFGRDRRGNVLVEPPVVEMITEDSLLADTKLIAEPWDAVGLYQQGRFPYGHRWMEWNGRFRDDVRRFWRGDGGMVGALATRICGSEDLYHGRSPCHSVNFITCHDGFTLADLVSYNQKHNEANGENNRDGSDSNWSWNCGVEGPSADRRVVELRNQQVRNMMATLLISQGVPMILGGDEFLRTQRGNNNAWCQDNEVSWVDWSLQEEHGDFLRFVKMMIGLRKRHPVLRRRTFFAAEKQGRRPEIQWHGLMPHRPDFSSWSHALAFTLDGRESDRPGVLDRDLYVAMNGYWEAQRFQIPPAPTGRVWRRTVDTALPSPDDIVELDAGPIVHEETTYRVEARSMIILISEA